MKEINLDGVRSKRAGQYVAVVDDCDYEWLSGFAWLPLVQGTVPNLRVYAVANVYHGKDVSHLRMHRLIWERANGIEIPNGYEIDHIEHGQFGGLDNRRSNLRLASKFQNQANSRRSRNNRSGYKGVYLQSGRWRAQIMIRGRNEHIGYFDTPEEAARAYDEAAVILFGGHAKLNFPEAA